MGRINRAWVPVGLWMAAIFGISTDLGSAAHTSRLLEPVLHWVDPGISSGTISWVNFIVRKSGHLGGYAVLSLLLLRAFRRSFLLAGGPWSWRAARWAITIVALYAMSDEYHQSFVASRTASWGDVLIDSTGGAVALLVAFAWMKLRWRTEVSPRVSSLTPKNG
jgi:VanZ family protein